MKSILAKTLSILWKSITLE